MLNLGEGNARLSYGKTRNYMVEGYIEDYLKDKKKFKDQIAYIDKDGYVWVYYEKKPNIGGVIPWFSIVDGEVVYAERIDKKVREAFKESNVRDISLDYIKETTKPEEDLYDEEVLRYLNASSSVFAPPINEYDDFLKKIIKKVLEKLQICISKRANQFAEKYTLSNLKTALQKETKMSPKVFAQWTELTGQDFVVITKSNGTIEEQMPGFVIYKSRTGSLEYKEDIKMSDIL